MKVLPKIVPLIGFLYCLVLFPAANFAQSRVSASYSLSIESATSFGGAAEAGDKGSSEVADGGQIAGVSSSGSYEVKHGFAGQVTNPIVLNTRSASFPAEENTTVQMLGQVILDDFSVLDLEGSDLVWSEIEGPISSIDGDGRVTLSNIDADTRATVLASYRNVRTSVSFIVVDDPAAPPLVEPASDRDGDGQSDDFEALAGHSPDDRSEVFESTIVSEGDGRIVELSRVIPGIRYIIEASSDLRIYRKVATIDPEEVETNVFVYVAPRLQQEKFYRVRLETLDPAE